MQKSKQKLMKYTKINTSKSLASLGRCCNKYYYWFVRLDGASTLNIQKEKV
jgi:hypothetical protein